MMRDFLAKKDQVKFDVIHYLYRQTQLTVSIDDIAKHTQLSELKVSTIINELIEDFANSPLSINSSGQFYRNNYNQVVKAPQFSIDIFLTIFLKRSIHYEFMIDLFFDNHINHEQYADKHHLSLSTIKREWRFLKNTLNQYGIMISKEEGLFKLVGPEEYIRYLYFKLFFISNFPIKNYLTYHNLNFYKQNITNLSNELSLKMSNVMLYISLHRAKKKNPILNNSNDYETPDFLFDKQLLNKIVTPIYQKLAIDPACYSAELDFYYFFINTRVVLTLQTVKTLNNYLSNELLENSAFVEANQLVNELVSILTLKVSPTDYFLISNFILSLKKNQVFGPLIMMDIDFTILNGFTFFQEKVADELLSHYHISVEQMFVILYPILEKNTKPLTLLVASRFGVENKLRIQQIIDDLIPSPIKFVEFIKDKPQLVITDIYFDTKEIPYYLIRPYPTLKEFTTLGDYLATLIV